MIVQTIIFLLLVFDPVQMQCLWSYEECLCENININNLLDKFYLTLYSEDVLRTNNNFSLTVQNAVGQYLNYIPKLPVEIVNLNIINSTLTVIIPTALQYFENLERICLSGNLLTDMLFL